MLRNMNELQDYAIHATDGNIGHVKDLYFDDKAWVIRYLIVDTGAWLSSRQVLISPIAIGRPNWTDKILPVSITKAQVKNSPDIDTHKPVSRQHEVRYLEYYGYPFYWYGSGLWGGSAYPGMAVPGFPGFVTAQPPMRPKMKESHARTGAPRGAKPDAHLRSYKAVMNYHVHATNGDIGHVDGMLVDEETWAIRYLVVNTSNWWLGHQVLVAPQWVKKVSWPDAMVSVDMSRQGVKGAPPYDPAAQFDRAQESRIYKHHGRNAYWAGKAKRQAAAPSP